MNGECFWLGSVYISPSAAKIYVEAVGHRVRPVGRPDVVLWSVRSFYARSGRVPAPRHGHGASPACFYYDGVGRWPGLSRIERLAGTEPPPHTTVHNFYQVRGSR